MDVIARLNITCGKRTGIHEFIFAKGKFPKLVSELFYSMAKRNRFSAAAKVSVPHVDFLRGNVRKGLTAEFFDDAGMMILRKNPYKFKVQYGPIGILTAGTSDIAVARGAYYVLYFRM